MDKRHIEIDILRTIAILGMIIYHTAFDLAAFYSWDIDVLHTGWRMFARSTAILFLVLVGISFVLSWQRTPNYKKQLRRAAIILGSAMLITIVTYIALEDQYVRFGILHLIGTAALLLPFFTPLKNWNVLAGLLLIGAGMFVPPPGFHSVDYFNPLPWLGVILIGMAIGEVMYVRREKPSKKKKKVSHTKLPLWTLPGRYSLWIYLLHQPIIITLLWILLGPWQS